MSKNVQKPSCDHYISDSALIPVTQLQGQFVGFYFQHYERLKCNYPNLIILILIPLPLVKVYTLRDHISSLCRT